VTDGENGSTARTVALLAAVAVIVGAIGPWQTTFIVDRAGTDGDGLITLVLGVAAGLLVFVKPPGSRWLMVAGLLGAVCAVVGIADLINVNGSTQSIYGRELKLVSPGWGLWVTAIAAIVLTVSAAALWTEAPGDEGAAAE
jgi:hypothetical protein